MLAIKTAPPEFPDDPRKWDGWGKYQSANVYERLCLDYRTNPTDEQIQQHCAALLQWWQNKLPLKNQPSNPLAQLLGRGIDDASRFLIEARVQLLDPEERARVDDELSARAGEEALEEFAKFVGFSIKSGVLSAEAEGNLVEYGQRNGFDDDQIRACIDEALRTHKARRAIRMISRAHTPAPAAPAPAPTPEIPSANADSEKEFLRILGLGNLDMASASYTVRTVFGRIGDNLGISGERAERLLDEFLETQELTLAKSPARIVVPKPSAPPSPVAKTAPPPPEQPASPAVPVAPKRAAEPLPASFVTPVGSTMVLLPSGNFVMGSEAPDAQPNEQPLTLVTLSEFYIAQHPVTNAQYEQFDPHHKQKRMEAAGDQHPVVYVTSFDAVKFCEWLGQRDGRTYRLPTEAEWEYGARGKDGRKYPWGNQEGRGDLANFADANTTFPWRDASINDGYAQTSPVGSFPRGASFFALEDMAGNVWEWCLDFFQPLAGIHKQNPRGPSSGGKRVYRGGSWKSRFTNLRASARASNAPDFSCNDVGFRIVCEVDRS